MSATATAKDAGTIYRIAGPVVTAININPRMYDVVLVGNEKLMGEVIQIEGGKTIIQVYEDTSGLRPGEPVSNTGGQLSVELGPGLLQSIYDGIQRPLPILMEQMGDFIQRGAFIPGLDHAKKWEFKSVAKVGDKVAPGTLLGTVQETSVILHKIQVPPSTPVGVIERIQSGSFTVDETICQIKAENGQTVSLTMCQRWPVRVPRPFAKRLRPDIPLITGQRVFDCFFPLAKGGTAAIPGPFGSGKTVSQQQLAKWSDAEIVVYIGCGERGNEMTEVLSEFPHLEDPKNKKPLMERTILIANTSNMPVAAREASVYTGITIAEYYRDMGYGVSLMADSTSRWAEAMREISSRLEEMPGEEGYPAYLATRLSQFYERAGRVIAQNGSEGSVSVIGAVSPAGGDFSEPVTQNTLRIVKVFWALDAKLAQRRHFPSINWLNSYSLYQEELDLWYANHVDPDYPKFRKRAMLILQKEAELQEIVQLVGADALPPSEQLTLEVSRLVREVFLQQNAYHQVDTFCPAKIQFRLMKTIFHWGDRALETLEKGASIADLANTECRASIGRARFEKDPLQALDEAVALMEKEFPTLIKK